MGSTEEDILLEMLSLSYDKFSVALEDIQILSLLGDEDWPQLMQQLDHDAFILKPMSLNFVVEKSLLLDDPRLPKLKISGRVPRLVCDVVDSRLVNVAAVLMSIPSPTTPAHDDVTTTTTTTMMAPSPSTSRTSAGHDMEHLENAFKNLVVEDLVQATDLLLQFNIQSIQLGLALTQDAVRHDIISFTMDQLGMIITKKTFEMAVDVSLNDLTLNYIDGGDSVTLVTSRCVVQDVLDSSYLLKIVYLDVDRKSPEFYRRYASVSKRLDVDICSLRVDFQREAVIDVMQVVSRINSQIVAIVSRQGAARSVAHSPADAVKLSSAKKLTLEGMPLFNS